MVRSTFLFARLRSAGGVYLSGGLKPATETSRILIYPPLIEAGVFPTEINYLTETLIFLSDCRFLTDFHDDRIRLCSLTQIRSPDEERAAFSAHFPHLKSQNSASEIKDKCMLN